MLVALVLFPLPWINLSCGEHQPGKERVVYFSVTQSGLQATYGGVSFHQGTMQEEAARSQGAKDKKGGAPLLVVYALLLVAGIVASFKIRGQPARFRTLAACAGGALALLLVQMAIGFPLEPEGDRPSGEPDAVYHLFLEVRYTIWFWLALAATIAACVLVWLDWPRRTPKEATEPVA
jgi:hypothetical protein